MSLEGRSVVTLSNDRDVVVVRTFQAPRTLVFDAWTKPELLQRWLLGPPGWTMPVCEMDVRVGGRFRWRWRNAETGAEFGFVGEFHEVVRPSRLVHVERYDAGDVGGEMGDALVTSLLTEAAGITTNAKTRGSDAGLAERIHDLPQHAGQRGMIGLEPHGQRFERLLGRDVQRLVARQCGLDVGCDGDEQLARVRIERFGVRQLFVQLRQQYLQIGAAHSVPPS